MSGRLSPLSLLASREALLGAAILGVLALAAWRFPGFIAPANLANVFNDTSILIILALGQMAVILTRCIDLSMASNLALCGMVAAMANDLSPDIPIVALILLAVSRDPTWGARLNRSRLRLPLLGIVIVNAMMLFWTLVGLMLGAIHLGIDQPAFSLTILAILALGLLLFSAVRGRPGWLTWSTVGVAAVSFAGLLPALAGVG